MYRHFTFLLCACLVVGLATSASAWTNVDVGTTTPGSGVEDAGTWTVEGNGADIWGSADGFHYVYKYLSGDGSISARVVEWGPGSNAWAKAGVMMRESLEPDSRHAFTAITAGEGGGKAFQCRPAAGGSSFSSHGHTPSSAPPFWVKIERIGDSITGYYSEDGDTWTAFPDGSGGDATTNPRDIDLMDWAENAGCYIGLAVTSHAANELRTATFDNVVFTGNVTDEMPPRLQAWSPNPANEAVGIATPLLQWSPGDTALFHDVYLGTSPDLTEADRVATRQPFAMYFHVPGFEPGTTYHWRVDEIEADGVTMYEGLAWSFMTQDLIAYNPTPADGTGSVSPRTALSWLPGQGAIKYHLYLGDDADAVGQGAAGTDQGELEEAAFTPESLMGGTTYFWRVDDITADGSVQTGDVWSFTTFMLVDDFEGYTDDEGSRIYESWIDGWTNNTGSTVGYLDAPFAEQTVVHGDSQSMPMEYDNSQSPFFSEAEYTLDSTQNWTTGGVDTLSLWVQGYPVLESIEVAETGGKMDVTGAGADIWGTSDQFTYAYKALNGNGTMVARVVSNGTGSNEWAKGGVMIRESLNGGSTHSMMVITAGGGNGASFQYREAADGSSSNVDTVSTVEPPYWVKIERMGDTFSGYLSADGNFWNTLGSMTIMMDDPIHIGLCVTSHAGVEERTFEFDSISSTGGVSGPWEGAIISAPAHNSTQSFYVVVEDSAGKSAMATDAGAVNAADWTEVKVSLSDLAGVDLTKVKKLYLGVGDPDNPTADGTGRIFIDDIRVVGP